jgi:hypothetical protein
MEVMKMDSKNAGENKRVFFRLDLYHIPVHIRVTNVMGQPIVENIEYKGWIKDISGGGISFYIRQKIEIAEVEELTFRVSFELMKRKFEYPVHITRYAEEGPVRHLYSSKFIFKREQEQSNIAAVLLRMDALRKK